MQFEGIKGLNLISEYGYQIKDKNDKQWRKLFEMNWDWKKVVKKKFEKYLVLTEGSSIEIKESSTV